MSTLLSALTSRALDAMKPADATARDQIVKPSQPAASRDPTGPAGQHRTPNTTISLRRMRASVAVIREAGLPLQTC
jgi:hypothetical protein